MTSWTAIAKRTSSDVNRELLAEHGSLRMTARELNRRGLASPLGRSGNGESVGLVINTDEQGRRLGPRKRTGRAGVRGPRRVLSKLLTCAACGRLLTPHLRRDRGAEYVSWMCLGSRNVPDHPRPFGRAESALLPLVRTEAEHMVVPVDRVEQREADEAALSALDERRARLVTAVEERLLTSGDVRERLAAIEAERSKVEAHAEILDVPQAIDWDWEPGAINDVLHALWGRVDVDLAGATVEITWRDPSLRRG